MGPCNIRTYIPALPFCYVTLSVIRPPNKAYPEKLATVGDHLRRRRLDLKLRQIDLADKLEVNEMTICNWEMNLTTPRLYQMPKINEFLGYNPLISKVTTFGERIKQFRLIKGLSLRKLAMQLGIDSTTLARWERDESIPRVHLRKTLSAFFGSLA